MLGVHSYSFTLVTLGKERWGFKFNVTMILLPKTNLEMLLLLQVTVFPPIVYTVTIDLKHSVSVNTSRGQVQLH